MIGSPDLLAFTSENDFSETSPDLPEEFSVPHTEFTSPWSARSALRFDRDFILIAEFSEQVGPQPLLTIPDKTRSHGSVQAFDLNQFSVRIMSADYQTVFVGHGVCGHPRLSFVEDSALVLEYPQERAFAYVHYLTLYDLEARGFVRPFCMAYVSSEERKIMQSFRRLFGEFSKASECLKTGNRKNFANEIDKRLADLEFTRLVLLRETSSRHQRNIDEEVMTKETGLKIKENYSISESDDGEIDLNSKKPEELENFKETKDGQKKAVELASLEKAIQEHRSLLREVTSFPNRKRRNQTFLPYDSDHGLLSLESHSDIEVPDREVMLESRTCSHAPCLVNSSSSRRFDKRLKNLEELCDEYFLQQTLKQLRAIEKSFRSDAACLLSQQVTRDLLRHLNATNFLFEYSPKRDSRAHSAQIQSHPPQAPPAASLESYASCVETVPIKLEPSAAPEFPLTIPTKDDPFPMKGSVSSGESIEILGTEKSFRTPGFQFAMETVPQRSACSPGVSEVCKRRVTTRREDSQDSIEVLSMTDSIIPDDLRASFFSAIHEETPEYQEHPEEPLEDVSPIEAQDDSRDFSDLEKNFDLNHLHFRPISRMNSDCTSLASTVSDISSFFEPNGKVKAGRGRRTRARSGRAMLHFLRRFPFAVHAVFSLLTGRTLVVMGSEESEVRCWVTALQIYTPQLGWEETSVRPWTSEPLQITDLLTWKLIGFNRTSGSAPCLTRYARYLSVLDVDQRTLRSPAYRGAMLYPLVEPSAHILGGTSYFLLAQSVIGQLVSRAFVLTFSHDLQRAADHGTKDRTSRFLCHFHEDDLKVLHFLSDLVTRHVTGSLPAVLRCSYSTSNVFKL